MAYTKCKLYVGANSETKTNINSSNVEVFCSMPNSVIADGLGMTSTGKLVIPSTGTYRLTAHAEIGYGADKDFVYFGFDYAGSDGTSSGHMDTNAVTCISCDDNGGTMNMYGAVSDVVTFTAGQVIGCMFMRGSSNTSNIKVYGPTITIEKLD